MDFTITPRATARLRLSLNAGVIVPAGAFVRASSTGEQFRTVILVQNLGSVTGNIFVNARSISTIPVISGAGDIDTIQNAISGWNSVTNPDAPTQPGDLDFSTGDLQLTAGVEEVAQNIRIRLRFFKGEWFLDTRVGMPYFEQFLVKNPNLDVVRFLFTKAIEDIPRVKTVDRLDLDLDRSSRTLAAVINVSTDLGETLAFEETLIFETLQ